VLYDVKQGGMGLVVVADWYSDKEMDKLKKFSDLEGI